MIEMKKILMFSIVCISALNAIAQNTRANDHARELLELTGAGKLGVQMVNNMIGSYKKQMSTVPDAFWDQFAKEVSGKEIVELIIPIYVKHYTDDEMVKLIEFYKSPLGQKVIEKLPLINQDSYLVGQEWGKKLGEKVLASLKEKGYLDK
jgi:hypothetical protein